MGFFDKLKKIKIFETFANLGSEITDEFYDELEESLILADTGITDISPVGNLKELIYLEIFMTSVSDFSPLVTCTSLQDLNVCWTYGKPDEIKEMTWLKNLWWCGISGYGVQLLHEALPDTRLEYGFTSSTGGGWRQLENYYAQRDLFGMRYMKG